jgi:glutaminyl-tRNA synthetase
VVKDKQTGEVVELRCTYDSESRGGGTPDGRVVKGTLHWVSAAHALDGEVRLYDYLFADPDAGEIEEGVDFKSKLNPKSLEVLPSCKVEPGLAGAPPGSRYQFLRLGYFCTDPDSTPDRLVFNRTLTLRDTWARIERTREEAG